MSRSCGPGMSEDYCEVIITAATAEWLADFTRSLVEARLAAGGQNIEAIRSIYRWRMPSKMSAKPALPCIPGQHLSRPSSSGLRLSTPATCHASSRCRSWPGLAWIEHETISPGDA